MLVDVAFSESKKGVLAMFSDGTTAYGSVILGADGPRSKVREFAMSSAEKAQVSKFPIWHHNMTVCYNDAEKARYVRDRFPTSFLALSPKSFHAFQSSELSNAITYNSYYFLGVTNNRQFLVSSMPDGPDNPKTWIFHHAMAWLGDSNHSLSHSERLKLVKERAGELGEPARSAFTWIPDDTPVYKADISYWISQHWDNRRGRISLVGDAAHPMPPCTLCLTNLYDSDQYKNWEISG